MHAEHGHTGRPGAEMARVGAPPERVDGPVFEEQESVRTSGQAARDELLLPGERALVLDASGKSDLERDVRR
jgi:hypothetical protein